MSKDKMTHAQELRIRRALNEADFMICAPFFRHELATAGVDPEDVSPATLNRLVWEEIWVKYGDAMEHGEVVERQVMNDDEDWSRKLPPDLVGVRLKRPAGRGSTDRSADLRPVPRNQDE